MNSMSHIAPFSIVDPEAINEADKVATRTTYTTSGYGGQLRQSKIGLRPQWHLIKPLFGFSTPT
jgi:hypothetical protein